MSNSPHLGIQLMSENVLQKEVLFNEAVITLDVVFSGIVIDITTVIPTSPADGDAYIVASGGSGAWTGADGNVVFYYNGWQVITIPLKTRLYVTSKSAFFTKNQSGWTQDASGTPTVLEDLQDVQAGSLVDGQMLVWKAAASKWVATTVAIATALAGLSDVSASAASAGQVLAYNASTSKWMPETLNLNTVLTSLSDVATPTGGYVAIWNATRSRLEWSAPSSLVTTSTLDNVGDVFTSGKKVGDVLMWNGAAWGPASYVNVYTFESMTDGPGTMKGAAGKVLVVNTTEDHIEYVDMSTALAGASVKLEAMSDVPSAIGTAGQVLVVNTTRNGFVYADPAPTLTAKVSGTQVDAAVSVLNFVGATVTEDSAGHVTVTVPTVPETTQISVHDHGTALNGVSTLDFEGTGVTLVQNGSTVSVTITEGATSSTLAALTDVNVAGVTAGQLLAYDTVTSTWKPYTVSSVIAKLPGTVKPALYELGPFAPPTAAMFPTRFQASGVNVNLISQRGLVVQPGSYLSPVANVQVCVLDRDLAANMAPWEMVCRVVPSAWETSGHFVGLSVRRGFNNAMIAVGIADDVADGDQRALSVFTYDGSRVETVVLTKRCDFDWLKIAFDGNNVVIYASADGQMWNQFSTISATNTLAGVPTKVGLFQRYTSQPTGNPGALYTYYQDPDYPAAPRIQNGFAEIAVGGLTDVDLTGLTDKQVLAYDLATTTWKPTSAAGGTGGATALSALTDVNVTEAAAIDGDVLTWDNSTGKWLAKASTGGSGSTGTAAVGAHAFWAIKMSEQSLVMAGNNVTGFVTLEMASVSGGATLCHGGAPFASSVYSAGSTPASNAFDTDASSLWNSTGNDPGTIGYQFTTAVSIAELRITARNDGYSGQAPHNFVVMYSDDGVVFTPLCEIFDASTWSNGQTKSYEIPTTVKASVISSGESGSSFNGVDIALFFQGEVGVSTMVCQYLAARAITIPAGASGSLGYAGTAPTADTVFTLSRDGSAAGSVTFAASSHTATVSTTADIALAAGDRLTLTSPAAANSIADVSITLVGARV